MTKRASQERLKEVIKGGGAKGRERTRGREILTTESMTELTDEKLKRRKRKKKESVGEKEKNVGREERRE